MNDVAPSRRGVGIVFQSYALFPHLSVLDNVDFSLRMRGVAGDVAGGGSGMEVRMRDQGV